MQFNIVVQMFPTQTFDSYKMAGIDLIHNLPTEQAFSQKYHQQPQQPSTQLRPKAQSTTKRATKALLIVDPDTSKPLDLVGVSSSGKSKSPEPASVTSPTQDAKRLEFMEKVSRTSAITYASAREPSPSMQQGEAAQQLPEGTLVKDNSVLDGSLRQGAQPQLGEQSQTAEKLQPAAPTQHAKARLIVDPDTNKPLDLELPTQRCLTDSLSPKVIKNYIQYVMQQMMRILWTCSSVVSQSCNNCTCLGHFTSLQLYIHVHTFMLSRVLL